MSTLRKPATKSQKATSKSAMRAICTILATVGMKKITLEDLREQFGITMNIKKNTELEKKIKVVKLMQDIINEIYGENMILKPILIKEELDTVQMVLPSGYTRSINVYGDSPQAIVKDILKKVS